MQSARVNWPKRIGLTLMLLTVILPLLVILSLLAILLVSNLLSPGTSGSPHYTWENNEARYFEGKLFPIERLVQWTPDGSRIVLTRPELGIWGKTIVIAADGSWLQLVTEDGEYKDDYFLDVSPDGTRIAYGTTRHWEGPYSPLSRTYWSARKRPAFEIETSRLDGFERLRLTKDAEMDLFPSWSPDGTRIAFVKEWSPGSRLEDSGVHTMALDGSDVRLIAPFIEGERTYSYSRPVWSPDGERLAYVVRGHADTGVEVYALNVVRADGSAQTRVAEIESSGSLMSAPAWSPGGEFLAFTVGGDGQDDAPGVYTVRADGAELSRVVDGVAYWAQWSTDGSEIYFAGEGIHAVRQDGSDLRTIFPDMASEHAALSPDGSMVVAPMGEEVMIASSDGSGLRYLARSNAKGELVAGSPRGLDAGADLTPCSREPNLVERVLGSWMLVVPEPGANPGLVQDCETLLTVRNALAGDAELRWNGGVPITEWEGVTIDGSPPRVSGLELGGLGLNGYIPPEIGGLTGLQILDLYGVARDQGSATVEGETDSTADRASPIASTSRPTTETNRLYGTIPPELGDLVELETLNLAGNYLSGPIPPELGRLANLHVLDLSDNYLSGCVPAELPQLWVDASDLERC